MTAQALSRASWPQLRGRLLVVPLGSCEQHGPHLPFDVDTCVASAVCAQLTDVDGVVLAPALGYGASGEHEGFPGTVSMGTEVLRTVLLELGRSASRWADRLLLVNGHGGNHEAVTAAARQLREEGRDAAWWPCSTPDADAHAGRAETSLMLAVQPTAVQLAQAAAGCTTPLADLLPQLVASGVSAISPNGVLGNPRGATAAEGARLLNDLGQRLRFALGRWAVAADGRLGSYP